MAVYLKTKYFILEAILEIIQHVEKNICESFQNTNEQAQKSVHRCVN